MAAVVADRVGRYQKTEDGTAAEQAPDQPAPEVVGAGLRSPLMLADPSHFMAAANIRGIPIERMNMIRPVTRPSRVAPRPVATPKTAIAR